MLSSFKVNYHIFQQLPLELQSSKFEPLHGASRAARGSLMALELNFWEPAMPKKNTVDLRFEKSGKKMVEQKHPDIGSLHSIEPRC